MTEKEKKIFNYGQIVGELSTIARFNDKTDHIYQFELNKLPLIENVRKSLENKIGFTSKTFNLNQINFEKASNLFFKLLNNKWFYAYQNQDDYHLKDVGDNFSLYFDDWKKEWIEEFIDFLLHTIEPKNIYEIEYVGLEGYYASDYDEFIFECDDEIYYFVLKVTD